MSAIRDLFRFINLWVVLGAVVLVGLFFLIVGGYLWYYQPSQAPDNAPTAVITIIPAPTSTPKQTPTPEVTPTATSDLPPSPPPGEIGIGAFVQITETGGVGLRLRSEAGLEGSVLILGIEAEVFQVKDGPVERDGYTWWYLVAPYDEARQGWAVSNYLGVVQAP